MHLVTQRYGLACERCNVMPAESCYTNDEAIYNRQIDRCDNKPAVWPSDRLVPRSIEDVPMTFTVDGEQVSTDKPKHVETVNHPNHYGGDTVYETIKVILAWGLDFEIGNAVKYLSRAGKKDPAKEIEDLRKAVFYIEHKIKRLSK